MFARTKLSLGLLAAFGSLAVMAPGAFAQSQTLDRVEITGSSIKRVASEGALPVQTITQADIQRSGVTSVTDLIQQLPVMQGFTAVADSVGGGGGGITTASIHDLGEQYTLVLLNGRRLAPATSGTTIDLNTIPLSAVERVEVLTDGASALYGADAIAGVVNFILKKGAAPVTIEARYNQPQHKGGESYNIALSGGIGDLNKQGFTLFGSLSYDKSKQLKSADRDFAKTGIIDFTDPFGRPGQLFNGSSRSVPPNIDVRYLNPSATNPNRVSTVSFSPYLATNGECPPAHQAIGRQCYFDYTSTVEISPEQERKSLFTTAEIKLGQSGLNAFADFAYVDAHVLARIAPYPAEFALSTTSPYYATYVAPYLTDFQKANLQSINVKYRLYDMGNRGYDYHNKSTHLVGGVKGSLGSWDLNSALTVSKQKQDQDYVSGFPLADKFLTAMNNGSIDPFPYAKGEMPASMLSALNATQFKGNYNTTDIKMVGLDARASRPLFSMGGGDAQLGLGAETRKSSYQVTANQAVANAEILFDDPQPEFDLSRRSAGLFTELQLPITNKLELTGSLRYDRFTGVDDGASGRTYGKSQSATTYKVHGRFQPTPALLLRGSYGTGFRVASMKEIAQPLVDFGVTSGTYDCPFTDNYDPLGYVAAGYTCDAKTQKEVFQGGNENLKPEKSKQWSLGAVFEVDKNVTLGLDYWQVKVRNAVSSVSEQLILDNPQKYLSLYTTKVKANGTYVAIKDMPINIGRTDNQGLDWDITSRFKTDVGAVTAKLSGTYMIKSRYTTPGTDDQWETSLGQFGVNDAVTFRNVIAGQVSLDNATWGTTLRMNYRSGYKDQAYTEDDCLVYVESTDTCHAVRLSVPEYITFDWQGKWMPTKSLTLTLGITNLFDVEPPLSLRVNGAGHQLGYDPRYASPYGRTFYLTAGYKF